MMDKIRVFRIFYHLSVEQNLFLVAQDAHVIIISLSKQLSNLEATLAETIKKLDSLKDINCYEYGLTKDCVTSLQEMLLIRDEMLPIVNSFTQITAKFWLCGPVDHTSCIDNDKTPIDQWRICKMENRVNGNAIPDILSFQQQCANLIQSKFSNMYQEMLSELQQLEEDKKFLKTVRPSVYLNKIPLAFLEDFDGCNQSVVVGSRYPVSHLNVIDPKFANMLGYSISRLLTFPLMNYVVNTQETTELVKNLTSVQTSTSAIVFYRSVTRQVIGFHWEIASKPIGGLTVARGVNISTEIEASRLNQAVNIQKMLRQWLHSIRNASFEQQAMVILDEVKSLENLMKNNNTYQSDFHSINESLKMLIQTAKTSVGLIDQALDSKGLTQYMSVGDFVNNIYSFPHQFAQSEGIGTVFTNFKFFLNGNVVIPDAFSSLFVNGDITSVQSVIQHILINAVRHTNPILGINVEFRVDIHESRLQFIILVSDCAAGGLPDTSVQYLSNELGSIKCLDKRTKSNHVKKYDTHFGGSSYSSLSGLPHIVEMYHQLTRVGGDDFDLTVTTNDEGTEFRVRFVLSLITPRSVEFDGDNGNNRSRIQIKGTILFVDDSQVIQKVVARYLGTHNCEFKLCSDGLDALAWFRENAANCCAVISDLEMPKMGGDILVQHIRNIRSDIPCFIVSGNDIAYSLPPGVHRAIVKPITRELVISILADIHEMQNSMEVY